jgi:MoaA/NifB/PqqE/SkfB family radical SAM enzyme
MQKEDILKEYVCGSPFHYLEIHDKKVWACCPSWLPTPVGEVGKLNEVYNGDTLKKIQESVLDGSYTYCDKQLCPYISELMYNNTVGSVFHSKSDKNLHKILYGNNGPLRINLAFDRSCNLSCPSCRISLIMANGEKLDLIDKTMDEVVEVFGKNIDCFYISGTADPFASKTFRNFLLNFDETKFPKLNVIHIHTNAILLDEEMWDKLKNVKKFIKTMDISIDAATKETYNIVRRGGDWDILQKNIKFIATIDTIRKKTFSFVVQDTNYTEMFDYYKMIMGLPHATPGYEVLFTKILNWGTFNEGEYKLKQIWNEEHPEFKMFLTELGKIANRYNSYTNMNDIINKHFSKKTKQLI